MTQLGAEVSAGRDLNVSAGRDLSAVASALEARRDIALSAGRDVTLAAAANEEHAYSKTRKVTYQEDKVAQQGTRVDAGGDLAINAGQDLRLIASQASAGDEAYLVAGDKLELLAANDSNYYLYDKKKKGDFGRKETRRDEVTDVKAVGSQISSGGDLTLLSGGDQTYQGAKLESGNDLAIVSGGAVTFEAVKDLHQESHEKSKGDLAWNSAKGKGRPMKRFGRPRSWPRESGDQGRGRAEDRPQAYRPEDRKPDHRRDGAGGSATGVAEGGRAARGCGLAHGAGGAR